MSEGFARWQAGTIREPALADPQAPARAGTWVVRGVLIAAILLGFFLRVYRPGADSPAWYDFFNADEAHYSYAVQNKIEFGQFFVNDAKYSLTYPLFSAMQYLWAAPWSDDWGLARYRMVSVSNGIVLCLLIGLFFPRGWLRLAAVALASLSFSGVVHSRYGIPEMSLAAVMTATVLLAIKGWQAHRKWWWFAAGVGAIACLATKLTGIVMIPVLLFAPILSAQTRERRWTYYRAVLSGMAVAALAYVAVAILPDRAAWLYFQGASTLYARRTAAADPLQFLANVAKLVSSPALQTMVILWMTWIAWVGLVFVRRLIRRDVSPYDAAIVTWLLGCVGVLSTTSYQPARWQVVLLPAVIILGLRFFLDIKSRMAAIGVFAAGVAYALIPILMDSLAVVTEPLGSARLLQERLLVLLVVSIVVCLLGVCHARYSKTGWRVMLMWAVIPLELVWQLFLVGIHVVPAYGRPDHWGRFASEVKALNSAGDMCIGGPLVQDVSLRVRVRTAPTFYLLYEPHMNDLGVYGFFGRQKPRPTHLLLTNDDVDSWFGRMPDLMKHTSLVVSEEHVSGGGVRILYLLKIDPEYWRR